ncbi:hypothetical protein [Rhodococcus koreensis]
MRGENVLVTIPADLVDALDRACEFTGLSREELILRGAMCEVVFQNSRPPSSRPYYCRPPDPEDAEGSFAVLAEQWTSRHGRPGRRESA